MSAPFSSLRTCGSAKAVATGDVVIVFERRESTVTSTTVYDSDPVPERANIIIRMGTQTMSRASLHTHSPNVTNVTRSLLLTRRMVQSAQDVSTRSALIVRVWNPDE
jgi:hypothetical protein